MKKQKLVLLLLLASFLVCSCAKDTTTEGNGNKRTIEIASLKGPTTMGMTKLMSDSKEGKTKDSYHVTMHGTADEIVTKLVKGEVDVALVPCNLASVLYKKTEKQIKVAAINTLGVLYIVDTGNVVTDIKSLKGKTIYATGKGTTPEYVLNYLLTENGLEPQKDVTIEYKSEATEVASILATEDNAIAMLPEPFVTTASKKNEKLRVALNLTDEWEKVAGEQSSLVTGVVVVRNEFLENNNEAFEEFLSNYKDSTEWVNQNVEEAATLVGSYDIVPEAVAKVAIPKCNIIYIDGKEMKEKVGGYLTVLFNADASSVGGELPDEAFYYE